MYRLRSLFKPTNTESSRSQGSTTQNIIAPSSNFNQVGGDQINVNVTNVHPTLLASAYYNASPPSQAPFNDAPLDNLSIHFSGRKKELELIAKAFERRRDIPLRCALHGNPGVGKSQLAYSWVKSTFFCKENAYIMWISASTVEKLFQGFCRLLRFANHPDQSHPDQNARLQAARRWLEEVDTGNWLLVFDNVYPETLDFLRQHLPRTNGRGTILFTTRTRDVAVAVTSTAGERHDVVEVPLLDVKEGVELFCGYFDAGKVDPSSEKVEAIIEAVGCLSLAISHAAAYMNQSRISLDGMLELYQSQHKIDVISWAHTLSDYEHKSVAATFTSQLQYLDQHSPDASNLLRFIAFFDPESISLEMLVTGAKAILKAHQPPSTQSPLSLSLLAMIQCPVARQYVITHLQTQCLITYHADSESPTFRIHDLIQLVVLEDTKSSGLEQELFELAAELVYAACVKIEQPKSPEWWPRCELLVPHIESLTLRQHVSIHAKRTLLLANHFRGMYLGSRGRYVEAESLYENVISDREQLFGFSDLNTFNVMHDLAWIYLCRGRYIDAETSLERVLEGYKTQLGPENRHTLHAMYKLACSYLRQNRHDDGESLLKQTLESQERQFGSDDDDTLYTTTVLANAYQAQARFDDAESLLTRVLQAREASLGSEHRFTLETKHSLGNVYLAQQHYDAAAALLQQVLRAWETHLGPQHPDTLTVMHSLARVYASQSRYGDAEKLLVHVLAIREQVLGLSHPFMQGDIKLLAWVYEMSGRLDEAKVLEQRISPSS